MNRPTRPPGPPYSDDEQPPPAQPPPAQPRFTPRPPPAAAPRRPAEPPPPAPRRPAGTPPGQPGTPPAGPGSAAAPPQARPTFTPKAPGSATGGHRRPSFTPREGYVPPDRRRAAPPLTAFLPPVPAGYPQQPFPQAYDYEQAPSRPTPRFTPVDRRAQPDDADRRTRVFEPDAERVPSTGPQPVTNTSPNLARSSKAMALGTLASRGTGFLRTLVLIAALGSSTLADAYNNSNTLPNTVYYLMLGGVFTAVIVPLLVRAAREDPDRGEGYAERIFTLGVAALLIVTVVATLLAGPFVDLYAGNISNAGEHQVMVVFAYFFIPQIFFYGMDSLLGAILNTRGRFGANMWTPVINNAVVIIVGGLFILTEGVHRNADNVSSGGIHLLAIGTTLGIVIQSVCLFPIVRRAGFSMRLRWDIRRSEIAEIGRMSGWMFGYVATQWLGNLVVQRVANAAGNSAALAAEKAARAHALAAHIPLSHVHAVIPGVGYSAYSYAWQLFQLPYAIVGLSVISALLPRMSGHASDRRYSLVRDDFSTGVRIASVLVVPAAVFLAVLGAPIFELLFSFGAETTRDAQYAGEVFGVFSLGLMPFMLTQLQLRVFYAFQETRTPAIIGMVMLIVGVLGDLVALTVLPATQTVIGLAFAYDLVTLTGAVISWPLLLRRVGSLDGWRITRSLVRMFLATLPGLVFAFVIMAVVGSFLHPGQLYGLVATVVGGGGALLLYAFCARLLGIEEFRVLMRSVAGRFG
jgi:putative peptidoglycan lipid II flippase